MALTTTIIERTTFGNKKIVIGSCVNTGTGGDVATGLNQVDAFFMQNLEGAAAESSVDETFPTTNDITVVTESGINFSWIAIGH